MTQDTNQATVLAEWWDQLSFDHKDLYTLTGEGELMLKAYQGYKERSVGTLAPDSMDMVFKLLTEKFPEVENKVTELVTEWNAEEDKTKLVGKLERVKEYLHHASAIGDFHTIYRLVENIDHELAKLVEENYKQKLALVEKAEQEASSEEWKASTDVMRDMAEEWKKLGYVEKERNDALWSRLEAAKDKFFERKREHQEDINKEMLQNLDLKMEVVEKAEALAASEDWKKATDELKALMEQWKGIGRTMHDKNEELWKRFTEANNAFFEKKKQHFDVIHKEQEENYQAKLALVEKAEALKESTDWNETTQAYTDLMDEWKKLGRVPKDKSDEVWNAFNAARDYFFGKKRESFESFKISLEDNYAQKLALLKRAEDLQNSNAWREATDELNELMNEWKKIGPVPRKHSNDIWDRFIKARKKFFERKDANREQRRNFYEKKEQERATQTKDFVGKIIAELREEEEKLADFKNGLENIEPGMKKEA
ncbi:MAG: DUF349 domain-containing protein, partial [Chitinophagaceae bacterium]|nr:DUF349 domain-containing protein [Chitinophagaceae bacterium]